MNRIARWSLVLSMTAALAACSDKAGTAAADGAASAATPVAASEAPASDAPSGTYELTKPNMDAYFVALRSLEAAARQDPALEDFTAMNVSEENGEKYAARLAGNPQAKAVIEKAGISTRDYALTGELLVTAFMASAALEGGQLKTLPEGIDPKAIEFVKTHEADIVARFNSKS